MSTAKKQAGVGFVLGPLRLKAGLTIEEAAQLGDYSVEYVTELENGTHPGSLQSLHALATMYAARIAGRDSLTETDAAAGTERPDPTFESRTCDVPGCVDGEHRYCDGQKDDLCFALGIGDSDSKPHIWYVAGYRDEASGHWAAFADPPEFSELAGATGLAAIERFATAFRTVQQHCDNLNQLERSTP
ncbi:XRE family transcriptional regulator [Leucobacter muris]|uniref:XRE family transcriptional regulator n=1 Tax=Leucobacter muris TaxID=1935379 RepID=A0ABX5QEM8_9MICO|nr:helix-turn-helix transcriptional regulator [Leucobacter muris]QAB17510.1 XRE family transcriptional regulator [Leucobacter muris]